jgi:hypothetical protein
MRNVLDAMKPKLYKGAFIMPPLTRSMAKRAKKTEAGSGDVLAGDALTEEGDKQSSRKGKRKRGFTPTPEPEAKKQKRAASAADQIAAGELKVFGAGSSKRRKDTTTVAGSSQDAPPLADEVERLTNEELSQRSDTLSNDERDEVERLTNKELSQRSDTLSIKVKGAIKENIERGFLNAKKTKMELEKYKDIDIDIPDKDDKSIFSKFIADPEGTGVHIVTKEGSRYVHSIDLENRYIGITDVDHRKNDSVYLSQATFLSWKTRVAASGKNMNDIKPSTIAVSFVHNSQALAAAEPFVEVDETKVFDSGEPGYYGAGIANPFGRSILYLLAQHSNDLGKPEIDKVKIERYIANDGKENLRITYLLRHNREDSSYCDQDS